MMSSTTACNPSSDSFRDENLITHLPFRFKKRKVHYNKEFYLKKKKKVQADWGVKRTHSCAGLVHASFQGPGSDLVLFTTGKEREN